jgi:hypothetical protein
VPAFEFIVLKPLKIGDRVLEPGEVTTVPNTWSARTLKVYLTEQYLQPGQSIPEEFEQHRVLTHLPDQPAPAVPRKSAELTLLAKSVGVSGCRQAVGGAQGVDAGGASLGGGVGIEPGAQA